MINKLKYLLFGQSLSLDDCVYLVAKSAKELEKAGKKAQKDHLIEDIKKREIKAEQNRLDFFQSLEAVKANVKELDRAYKKMAWTAHPDRGGSNEKMMLVNAAYEAIRQTRGWTK